MANAKPTTSSIRATYQPLPRADRSPKPSMWARSVWSRPAAQKIAAPRRMRNWVEGRRSARASMLRERRVSGPGSPNASPSERGTKPRVRSAIRIAGMQRPATA
jgi:hypothetical protein